MQPIADPLLTVDRLTMRFGGLVAINALTFEVGRGEITALIGPNGAGKTTVFNCITGFYQPTGGRMALAHRGPVQDQELAALTASGRRYDHHACGGLFLLERMQDHEIAAKARVARTFQNIRLFPAMTVLENLIVAQHRELMKASRFSIAGLLSTKGYRAAEEQAVQRARLWLEKTGLVDRADEPAGDLPYGAQRRLEIARAMCTQPILLCLDEPAAGLNPRESADLTRLIRAIRDETGTSVLLIEHDMSVVMEISDHVVVIEYGCKIADGTPDEVKSDAKVIAAYLGVEDAETAVAVVEAGA